jgi:hypothetical protein
MFQSQRLQPDVTASKHNGSDIHRFVAGSVVVGEVGVGVGKRSMATRAMRL